MSELTIDGLLETQKVMRDMYGLQDKYAIEMHPDSIADIAARYPAQQRMEGAPAVAISFTGVPVFVNACVPRGEYRWCSREECERRRR